MLSVFSVTDFERSYRHWDEAFALNISRFEETQDEACISDNSQAYLVALERMVERKVATSTKKAALSSASTQVFTPSPSRSLIHDQPLERGEILVYRDRTELISFDESKGIGWPDIIHSKPSYGVETIPMPDYYAYESVSDVSRSGALWTGIAMGSGVFDPSANSTSVSGNNVSLAADNSLFEVSENELKFGLDQFSSDPSLGNLTAEAVTIPQHSETSSPGISASLGINLGKSIGKRFYLQSGVLFGSVESVIHTNYKMEDLRIGKNYILTQETKHAAEFIESITDNNEFISFAKGEYEVSKTMKFINVPFSVGYNFIASKKWNVSLLAGISMEFFLESTFKSTEEGVETLRLTKGKEGPYNAVYVSRLVGLNFEYKIAKRAMLQFSPSYRQSLNSLSKDELNYDSNPSSYGLNIGLRYNL